MPQSVSSSATPEPGQLAELETGRAYRFAEHAALSEVIPGSGAGVYTIWDDEGALVYVGVAGRNPSGKGLASRLRSHASGRRSGDQFCVYVADHYVLPALSRQQIEAIRDSRLSMDASCASGSIRPSHSASSESPTTALRSRSSARSRPDGCRPDGLSSTQPRPARDSRGWPSSQAMPPRNPGWSTDESRSRAGPLHTATTYARAEMCVGWVATRRPRPAWVCPACCRETGMVPGQAMPSP
jgi:hypothetical protein